ncbi:MAG: glycosyltransferase family 9 protein [Verrucomicrobiota bacterium]
MPLTESPCFPHLINKVENRRICFMPMAPWPGKLWQKESWQKLASTFRSEKYEVTVLCGPKQTEATRAEVGADLPIVECGSMAAWIFELNRCSCLISVDSGPMHLADALRVPLVALFGQGKLPLWAPSSKTSRYLHHQDDPDFQICQPIFKNISLGREFMNRITTAEVLSAAREVMAGSLTSVQST